MRARTTVLAVAAVAVVVAMAGIATRYSPGPGARASTLPADTVVASVRAEPRSFNRYMARDLTSTVVTYLLHSGLVRINRVTDQLEPELADRWELLADQRTYRVHLRDDVVFSDGTPFTAEDVTFSFRAIYDPRAATVVADSLLVGDQPLTVSSADAHTVLIQFPARFGPGLRLLDGIPIFPRHKLEAALLAGTFQSAWDPSTPPAEIVGLGPFTLKDYLPGQRLVFESNPTYFRRGNDSRLLYAKRLVLEVLRDQDAEAVALETASIDFTQSELRPMDIAPITRPAVADRVAVTDLGVGIDGDLFWINLGEARTQDRRARWLQHVDFRRAIAHAVDRDRFVNNVFLGAAVPGYGVISPGNRQWYAESPSPHFDLTAARALLASLRLSERDGQRYDLDGDQVRFTILTQQGNTSLERGAAAIRDSLAALGIQVDVVGVEPGALVQRLMNGDYDAAYFRLLTTDTDPALNPDFWRSSGSAHVWNVAQRAPSTDWEREIDSLMDDLSGKLDPQTRHAAFAKIQQIMGREVPAMCFAFPRLSFAMSRRLAGATPAPFSPPVLWNPAVVGIRSVN